VSTCAVRISQRDDADGVSVGSYQETFLYDPRGAPSRLQ